MADHRKTVAIIGAGPSGLTTARSMLASNIRPMIFEAKPKVGGLWSNSTAEGIVGLNPEMTLNHSIYTCSFSDLAWPEKSPMFPAAKEMGWYLERYQEKYIPDEMLKLSCEVTAVTREDSGGWKVEWKDKGKNNKAGVETFDFLAICSGFFSAPYIPPIDGLENFKGDVHHYSDYAKLDIKGKKKIVVVGGSMSGAEIAADLALRLSSLPEKEVEEVEIIHLFSRPFWVLTKYFAVSNPKDTTAPRFLPLDLLMYDFNMRLAQSSQPPKPMEEIIREVSNRMREYVGHDQSEISPELHVTERYMQQMPWVAISDSYANFVRSGAIKTTRGRVSSLSSDSRKSVVLESEQGSSGEEITDVDMIILATGYHPTSSLQNMFPGDIFSSLTSSQSPSTLEDPNFSPLLLYNLSLHPVFQKTGGFVGMYKGPYFGVLELQGRWLAGLFSGKLEWPSDEDMGKGIEALESAREQRSDAKQKDFRPQWAAGDYLGVANDLRERLGLPSSPSSTQYFPNTMIPAHFKSVIPLEDNEPKKALSSLKSLVTSPPTKASPFIANAIFRSLHGKWKLSRRIDSKKTNYPSGNFTGTAEFKPREPTFTPSPRPTEESNSPTCSTRLVLDRNKPIFNVPGGEVLEYLYCEEGSFATDTGLTMTGQRSYIYRYHPDEDVITVWFVKANGTEVDYFFHEISILPASEGDKKSLSGAGEVDMKGGWKARSEHLCIKDWYWPSYRFAFRSEGSELEKFWIRYKVNGPFKDYTAEAKYQRG